MGWSKNADGDNGSRETTAYLCMTIIGVGYLFPISAIWAAFDYWKVLFPDENIEFSVTMMYQVGSVATVAVLSFGQTMSLGPRIIGGFCGQFVCLAVIFAFRWITLDADFLYDLLIFVVFACSIATGYLDSALLALCSQYSPKMQQYLQIGIGFGTLVSVLYRDCTKLALSGDIADATSAYFAVALMTVLICISSYKVLMSLPASRHINDGSGKRQKLLGTEAIQGSPRERERGDSDFFGCTFSPVSPAPRTRDQVSPSIGDDAVEDEYRRSLDSDAQISDVADAGFKAVFSKVWLNQTVIFLNLLLTTSCYPGILTSIPCRQFLSLREEHWFQTLLLTAFTLADIVARFLTHLRCGLNHSNVVVTVLVRVCVFPLVLYCASSESANDVMSFIVVASFGFLNGYCVSLSLIVVNEIPQLTDEQRKTCGRISACSVNSGLCLGSFVAAWIGGLLNLTSG